MSENTDKINPFNSINVIKALVEKGSDWRVSRLSESGGFVEFFRGDGYVTQRFLCHVYAMTLHCQLPDKTRTEQD